LDFGDGQSRGGRHARRSDQKRSARRMKRLLLRRNGGAHRFRRDRYVAQRAPTAVKMAFPIAWPTTAVSGSPRPTGPGKRSKATSIRRGRRDAPSPRSPPRVGGDEMRCLRSVANLEAADRLLQCPVGVRDPFVLTKVVQPGIDRVDGPDHTSPLRRLSALKLRSNARKRASALLPRSTAIRNAKSFSSPTWAAARRQ
jgi:hypothetical protein